MSAAFDVVYRLNTPAVSLSELRDVLCSHISAASVYQVTLADDWAYHNQRHLAMEASLSEIDSGIVRMRVSLGGPVTFVVLVDATEDGVIEVTLSVSIPVLRLLIEDRAACTVHSLLCPLLRHYQSLVVSMYGGVELDYTKRRELTFDAFIDDDDILLAYVEAPPNCELDSIQCNGLGHHRRSIVVKDIFFAVEG